jgi:acyl-CoA reductase-like NAD-dependent aldehyde dehydrogenase
MSESFESSRAACSVPFGGMKATGVGREGGEKALRFFTEPKNVCIAKTEH